MQEKHRGNAKKAVAAAAVSLLLQLGYWLIYQWTEFPAWLHAVAPLVLCALYHALQAEPPEKRGMRRSTLFAAAVAFPLVLSVLVTVGCFLYNPDLPVFHPLMEQTPSAVGYVALFSGRITITSLYGLAFAGLDALLLRLQGIRRSRKERT